MKKRKIIGITAVTMIVVGFTAVAGVIGITKVSAALNNGSIPTIITNLATKFNLNPTDVQKVFDDTKAQQADARLSQLVTDGKITEAQKQLIISKRTEFAGKITEIDNKQLTTTERSDALTALRDELTKWASDNKIDLRYVEMGRGMGGLKFGGHMQGGMGGFMGDR